MSEHPIEDLLPARLAEIASRYWNPRERSEFELRLPAINPMMDPPADSPQGYVSICMRSRLTSDFKSARYVVQFASKSDIKAWNAWSAAHAESSIFVGLLLKLLDERLGQPLNPDSTPKP